MAPTDRLDTGFIPAPKTITTPQEALGTFLHEITKPRYQLAKTFQEKWEMMMEMNYPGNRNINDKRAFQEYKIFVRENCGIK